MSKEQRATALHREAREELTRADGKATTLLSVVGLILGALLAGSIAGDVDPRHLDNRIELLFWAGCCFGLASAGLLIDAVIPRTKHPTDREHLRYFGHVVAFSTVAELRRALERVDREYERTIDQVHVLSGIVQAKYERIRRALHSFVIGAVLVVAAILIDYWIF